MISVQGLGRLPGCVPEIVFTSLITRIHLSCNGVILGGLLLGVSNKYGAC